MITDVVVRDAPPKGKGVFALRSFRKGEFIFRRRHGRVVSPRQEAQLSVEDGRHLTELDFDRSAVLLPPGCYLNHSCEPNAMRSGVKVFAWRALRKGEEITIDYRLNAFSDVRSRCRCGSRNCAGIVQWSFFALDAKRQRRYLPYALTSSGASTAEGRDRRFEAGSRRLRTGQRTARICDLRGVAWRRPGNCRKSVLRVAQNPDLLAAVGGWPVPEVAVVGNHFEAEQLEEIPHLAPQGPAQGELLGGGPKHLARCVDLAECPIVDDELAGRIGPPPRDLPRHAVSGRWMSELAASRGAVGARDDAVEQWVEQVEDEPTIRAQMGPKCRQRLPLCGGREHELEDPGGRHDEREVASEIEGRHVR